MGETPDEQARAFSALLDTLGIDRVFVVGTSGGGPSSIRFAALFPEKTISLITSEPASQIIVPKDEEVHPFFLKSDFVSWMFFSLMNYDSIVKPFIKESMPYQDSEKLIQSTILRRRFVFNTNKGKC